MASYLDVWKYVAKQNDQDTLGAVADKIRSLLIDLRDKQIYLISVPTCILSLPNLFRICRASVGFLNCFVI
jgi:hypothetical protein